jgi:hypothetical protein
MNPEVEERQGDNEERHEYVALVDMLAAACAHDPLYSRDHRARTA